MHQRFAPRALEQHSAREAEYDGSRGFEYKINEDVRSATLVGFGNCSDRDVTVAEHYDGKPVTVIGQSAFENCQAINSITLPDTTEEIVPQEPEKRIVYISFDYTGHLSVQYAT